MKDKKPTPSQPTARPAAPAAPAAPQAKPGASKPPSQPPKR